MRKKQCEGALEELVKEKKVTLKEYGKAKIFLINQDRFPKVDLELLNGLDITIAGKKEEFTQHSEETKELEKKFKEATSSHTNEDLASMIEKLVLQNETMSIKVNGFKSGGIELLSKEQINESLEEQKYYAQTWKKVKRECKEMMEVITEPANMNTK